MAAMSSRVEEDNGVRRWICHCLLVWKIEYDDDDRIPSNTILHIRVPVVKRIW